MKIAKTTIAFSTLILSANVFAYTLTDATALTLISPILTSATTSKTAEKALATAIINDAQDYIQSGRASVLLRQEIKEVQSKNVDLAEEEALEMLIDAASAILN